MSDSFSYEHQWAQIGLMIGVIIKSGETDLARVTHKLHRDFKKILYMGRRDAGNPAPGPMDPFGFPLTKQVSMAGEILEVPYFASINPVVEWVFNVLEQNPDVDAVCELGAGWGRNLFNLYLAGIDRSLPLYCGEITESGRDAAGRLEQLDDDIDFNIFHFDFLNPDLTPLKGLGLKHILFFTRHSIEQVPEIGEEPFEEILSCASKVTCLHFEPFGFQIETPVSGPEGDVSRKHAQFMENRGWNRNLYPTLSRLEEAGRLELRFTIKNVIGDDPSNPTSIALWTKRE